MIDRTNPYKLPLIDNMFEVVRELYDSSYYGYINSDILISPSLFDALAICIKNVQLGILESNVVLSTFFNNSMKSREECMKLPPIIRLIYQT